MHVQRIAAFSDGNFGGNPAGVALVDEHPPAMEMQRIAMEVGFSETAFAKPASDGFRVRYFSPESEVPFCGHATIALGAALALAHGDGVYPLQLNEAAITVEGTRRDGVISAVLQSPPTHSSAASPELVASALKVFGYTLSDLSADLPPALIHGGANHLLMGLNSRSKLSAMDYELEAGRTFMVDNNLITVMLAYTETPQRFHTRNPFASGGVLEDPATGAATAAFAGYLRDINWPHGGSIDVIQGEDMGMRSLLRAEFSDVRGSSVRVSGTARVMDSAIADLSNRGREKT